LVAGGCFVGNRIVFTGSRIHMAIIFKLKSQNSKFKIFNF
jgi:hypothetical protein